MKRCQSRTTLQWTRPSRSAEAGAVAAAGVGTTAAEAGAGVVARGRPRQDLTALHHHRRRRLLLLLALPEGVVVQLRALHLFGEEQEEAQCVAERAGRDD